MQSAQTGNSVHNCVHHAFVFRGFLQPCSPNSLTHHVHSPGNTLKFGSLGSTGVNHSQVKKAVAGLRLGSIVLEDAIRVGPRWPVLARDSYLKTHTDGGAFQVGNLYVDLRFRSIFSIYGMVEPGYAMHMDRIAQSCCLVVGSHES